jgi:hypothetical protein
MLRVFNVKPIVYLIAGASALVIAYLLGWIFDLYLKEDFHRRYFGKFKM